MIRQILNHNIHRITAPSVHFSSSPANSVNNTDVPVVDFDDPSHIPVAVYPRKLNEPLEQRKQRLVYQSRKRGMLENDLLLSTFVSKYLNKLSIEEIEQYDNLINGVSNDWDIYHWITKIKPTPAKYDNQIMRRLKEHVANENREMRFSQPPL